MLILAMKSNVLYTHRLIKIKYEILYYEQYKNFSTEAKISKQSQQ